ncbi:DUF5947 family protein [Actinomadura mexicana]|uniref:Uncharacterized protein n=1 Tax=Actinomadura mexicana TaxID=134959 RepID=A0A238WRJ6_9ACTN|nr:DUF5947 family protein [Actinomadura mexicana]SNR49135.1 hypothetical protein SAMN06265355_103202 [Actinomadura mexicana]
MTPGLRTPRLAALASAPPCPAPPPGGAAERCELCAEPVHDAHRHLLDLEEGELLCACGACAVLFDGQAAGGRHYRLVPDRRRELTGFRLDGPLWAGLEIPVDLAFFSVSGTGEVTARYPSPAGALHAAVHAGSWRRLAEANPVLAELRPDVEALVVHRARDAAEHWMLPVDDCYRLTALLREHWTGFTGGDAVWHHIGAFFTELKAARAAAGEKRGTR